MSLFFMIIMLLSCLSPFFINCSHYGDKTEGQTLFITLILAARSPQPSCHNLSSFQPWVFHSGSGRLHLLFVHEIIACDTGGYEYYHTYEFDNGSWAPPKKLKGYWYTIFDIVSTIDGVTIYYYGSDVNGYPSSYLPLFAGIFKMHYNEDLDEWSDPVELFGESHTRDYLQLAVQQIHGNLHSFLLFEEEELFVVWSFQFWGQDVNVKHEYKNTFIVSKIDKNGVIASYPLVGLGEEYDAERNVRIVEQNDFFYLYILDYTKRANLFSNGTTSEWYASPVLENMSKSFPFVTFADHHVLKCWETDHPVSVVEKRYLVYYSPMYLPAANKNEILIASWDILDLASTNLTAKSFMPPYQIIPGGYVDKVGWFCHRTFDFEHVVSSNTGEIFVTPIFTDSTIELWEFDYGNTSWKQISALDYLSTIDFTFLQEVPVIELFVEGNNMRIFWPQLIWGSDSSHPLNEIFTVTYDRSAGEWGPVIQVTNTRTILDDHYICESTPAFSFIVTLLSFVMIVLFTLVLKVEKPWRKR